MDKGGEKLCLTLKCPRSLKKPIRDDFCLNNCILVLLDCSLLTCRSTSVTFSVFQFRRLIFEIQINRLLWLFFVDLCSISTDDNSQGYLAGDLLKGGNSVFFTTRLTSLDVFPSSNPYDEKFSLRNFYIFLR